MEKYASSGAFDVIPGGSVDPETDATTYNGSIWLLARQTYWRDPEVPPAPTSVEFQNAMSFYSRRAVPEEMRCRDWLRRWTSALSARDSIEQQCVPASRADARTDHCKSFYQRSRRIRERQAASPSDVERSTSYSQPEFRLASSTKKSESGFNKMKILYGLLVFLPVAIVAELMHAPPLVIFACSALAILPLAGSSWQCNRRAGRAYRPDARGIAQTLLWATSPSW
jgi:hypothetical protein